MSIITENAQKIRNPMIVNVTVGDPSDPIFALDNSNIISCELNLRADLKPIDPSLPESEIVVQAYWAEDISEYVFTIADDTVITYTAGYTGYMSPVRTFYVSEHITWEDHVLTIKGVDAVHFLDVEVPPVAIQLVSGGFSAHTLSGSSWATDNRNYFGDIYSLMRYYINRGGFSLTNTPTEPPSNTSAIGYGSMKSVIERGNARDIIANFMNLLHVDFDSGFFSNYNSLWLTYVDAGRPWYNSVKPTSKYNIYETDCGDICVIREDKIAKIEAKIKTVEFTSKNSTPAQESQNSGYGSPVVGSAEIIKNAGASLKFDKLSVCDSFIIKRDTVPSGTTMYKYSIGAYVAPGNKAKPEYAAYARRSYFLRDGENPQFQGWTERAADDTGSEVLSTTSPSGLWTALNTYKYIQDTNAKTIKMDIIGDCFDLISDTKTITSSNTGITAKPSKTTWTGEAIIENTAETITKTLLPDEAFKALMNRSNETGSFTWKGDPRMQPRDVFTFNFKDGSTELRTIESINLKHEGGGTIAKITYRKGIV